MNNKDNLKKELSNIVRRLKPYKPEKVILFGSYAYGKAKKNSDLDLLVIKKTSKKKTKRVDDVLSLIYNNDTKQWPNYPLDILVYTPKELEYRRSLGDFFVKKILEQGKVIYEQQKRTAKRMV